MVGTGGVSGRASARAAGTAAAAAAASGSAIRPSVGGRGRSRALGTGPASGFVTGEATTDGTATATGAGCDEDAVEGAVEGADEGCGVHPTVSAVTRNPCSSGETSACEVAGAAATGSDATASHSRAQLGRPSGDMAGGCDVGGAPTACGIWAGSWPARATAGSAVHPATGAGAGWVGTSALDRAWTGATADAGTCAGPGSGSAGRGGGSTADGVAVQRGAAAWVRDAYRLSDVGRRQCPSRVHRHALGVPPRSAWKEGHRSAPATREPVGRRRGSRRPRTAGRAGQP
jgi:hypothetical protein